MSALMNRTDWFRPPTRRGTRQEAGLLGLTEAEREEIQARIAVARMAKAEPDPAPWLPPGAARYLGAERPTKESALRGMPGVTVARSGRLIARVTLDGRKVQLGTYDTAGLANAAIQAHRKARPTAGRPVVVPGVYRLPSGRYQAKMRGGGATRSLGSFDTVAEAAAAAAAFRDANPL